MANDPAMYEPPDTAVTRSTSSYHERPPGSLRPRDCIPPSAKAAARIPPPEQQIARTRLAGPVAVVAGAVASAASAGEASSGRPGIRWGRARVPITQRRTALTSPIEVINPPETPHLPIYLDHTYLDHTAPCTR